MMTPKDLPQPESTPTKGVRELGDPQYEAETAAIAHAIAAAACFAAGRRGWSNEVAGVLAYRAAVALLLRKNDAGTVVDWLDQMTDSIEELVPPRTTN